MPVRFYNFPVKRDASDVVRDFPYDAQIYPDATATPSAKPGWRRYSGHVYDRDGRLIRSAARPQYRVGIRSDDPLSIDPTQYDTVFIPGRSLYLGILFQSFGHFLLESISRMWSLKEFYNPGTKLVFHPWRGYETDPILKKNYVLQAFDRFGIQIDDLVFCADQPLRFEELVVPDQLWHINQFAHPDFLKLFHHAFAPAPSIALPKRIGKQLYLSRARWTSKRHAVNETAVEKLFKKNGFQVIYPEAYDFPVMTKILSQAEGLAGVDGSAMHLGCLTPGSRAVLLDSRPVVNQVIIDQLAGLDSHHIWAVAGDRGKKWNIDLPVVETHLSEILSG